MKNRKLSIVIFLITCFILLSVISYGDVYIKQKTHVDGMEIMEQNYPAQDFIVETWITLDRVSVEDKNSKTIMDLDKEVVTIADHNKKTIMTMPLNFSKISDQKSKDMSKEDKAYFKKLMGSMMQVTVSVEETNEMKKIGSWKCRKYIQTMSTGMGEFKSEIWATEDIEIDPKLYAKYISSMKSSMPGMNESMNDILRETQKIKGVQVYAEHTNEIMGQTVKSSTKLINYKEGQASAAAFKIPNGYKRVEF
jgi:hypothetical protein